MEREHIFLIGFSGSGKSTVGPILAKQLRRPYIDTDAMIARRERKSINELFILHGEGYFRKVEAEVIRASLNGRSKYVVGLGGGAFHFARNRAIIQATGTVIYLQTSVKEIYRRLKSDASRPLLQVFPKEGETGREVRLRRISELLAQRLPTYGMADVTVSTTGRTPSQVVRRIVDKLDKYHAHGLR